MPRVVHFEINAEDPERAMKFYKTVFNWKFNKWEQGEFEYWLIETGKDPEPGIDGGLFRKQTNEAPVRNTIGVEDIDEAIKNVEDNGGKIVYPKSPIPGVGWLAYFADTEGNMTGLMQSDMSAK